MELNRQVSIAMLNYQRVHHIGTALRFIHAQCWESCICFWKKTTTIPYLNKSGDEHPFIPVIFRIGIPGICPIPGKMTKRTVFFWFMDQQNMKDATINAITSLKRWIWGYSEYSIRVCSCVCVYIMYRWWYIYVYWPDHVGWWWYGAEANEIH